MTLLIAAKYPWQEMLAVSPRVFVKAGKLYKFQTYREALVAGELKETFVGGDEKSWGRHFLRIFATAYPGVNCAIYPPAAHR